MTSRNTWEEDGVSEFDVVIPRQDEIAVYRSEAGLVVIRQSSWPDDDVLVILGRVFRRSNGIETPHQNTS